MAEGSLLNVIPFQVPLEQHCAATDEGRGRAGGVKMITEHKGILWGLLIISALVLRMLPLYGHPKTHLK